MQQVLFYCHFPDQLLVQKPGFIKRLYRIPFNWLEEFTTGDKECLLAALDSALAPSGCSHRILVNSKFTRGKFAETFGSLRARVVPDVLYPSLDLEKYDRKPDSRDASTEAIRCAVLRACCALC